MRRPDATAALLSERHFLADLARFEAWAFVELARIEDEGRYQMFRAALLARKRHWVADEIDELRRSFGLE